jgi:hypothetical protein
MLLTLKLSPTYFQRWCPGVSELQTWHSRRCRCTASLGDILVSPSHKVDRAGSVRASGMGHNFARNPMTCCSKGTSEVQFASFPQPISTRKGRTHTSPSYLPALTGATATYCRSVHHIEPPSCIYFHRIHQTHFKTRSPDHYHVEDTKPITYQWYILDQYTMRYKSLTITGTYVVPDSRPSQPWSRESIIALATIFVMIFLSSLGFMLKHRLRKLMLSCLGQRWPYKVAQGIHAKHWHRSRRLTTLTDIELAPISHVAISLNWVDMADVRRYQQETYTSFVRSRRGPRMARFGSAAQL